MGAGSTSSSTSMAGGRLLALVGTPGGFSEDGLKAVVMRCQAWWQRCREPPQASRVPRVDFYRLMLAALAQPQGLDTAPLHCMCSAKLDTRHPQIQNAWSALPLCISKGAWVPGAGIRSSSAVTAHSTPLCLSELKTRPPLGGPAEERRNIC